MPLLYCAVLLNRPVIVGSREQIVIEVTDSGEADNQPAVEPDPQPSTGANPEPGRNPLLVAGWITAGVGAATLIAGGVTGGLALKWNNELSDSSSCSETECAQSEHDTIEKRDSAALASTILLSTGGAIAVAGVVMIVVGYKKRNKQLSVYPVIQTGMLGAAISGRF